MTYDADLDELVFYPIVEIEQLRTELLYQGNVSLNQVSLPAPDLVLPELVAASEMLMSLNIASDQPQMSGSVSVAVSVFGSVSVSVFVLVLHAGPDPCHCHCLFVISLWVMLHLHAINNV